MAGLVNFELGSAFDGETSGRKIPEQSKGYKASKTAGMEVDISYINW